MIHRLHLQPKKYLNQQLPLNAVFFTRVNTKKCFAYAAQTGCDKHGYVVGVTVNPGNVHDSVAFDGLYDELTEKHPEIEIIAADSAYKTPWICKKITDDNRIMSMPYKRPMGKDGFFRPHEYVYDEYYDCVICPENQILKYSTTNRDGYREYKSDKCICRSCPSRERCTHSKDCKKVVTIHIWNDYVELAEDYRHTSYIKQIYKKGKKQLRAYLRMRKRSMQCDTLSIEAWLRSLNGSSLSLLP